MTDAEKFAVGEVKDFLKDVNASISKTRDKCWQLFAFLLAIDIYLIKSILEAKTNPYIIGLTVTAAVFSIPIVWSLYGSMFPIKFNQSGGHPDNLSKVADERNDDIRFRVVMNTYKTSIDENCVFLSKMTGNYKTAINLFASLVLVSVFLLFLISLVEPV